MVIESLDLKNYRNYEYLNMIFDNKINIIYGDNAQGKTNILESIYVCATSKSHRGNKDKEIIRFDNDEAHIKLHVKKHEMNYRIDMHLKKNKPKGIAVNGIPIKKAVELFGILNIVFFSPEDLNIIKNGPSERRRFIDMELSQLDKIYFEGGGGGNAFESYTAAWYFGLNHCKLDCWNRGNKGIIITLGDEPLNPYLLAASLSGVTGDKLQGDVETDALYKEVIQKYDVYHLAVEDRETSYWRYADRIKSSFGKYLDENHLKVVNMNNLANTIVGIVANSEEKILAGTVNTDENGEISW